MLHVIDASAPDRDRRMNAVRSVLDEVGAIEVPMLEVYNKCDALTPDERRRLQERIGARVVARAAGEICQSCFLKMNSQMYNEVLVGQKLLSCPADGRSMG